MAEMVLTPDIATSKGPEKGAEKGPEKSLDKKLAMENRRQLMGETKPFSEENIYQTWRLWLETWGVALGLWTLTLPWTPIWLRISASLVLGLVTVRLFIFYHDYLHGAIFRGSRLVKFPMFAFGVAILNPPSVWKRSHNYHHQNNCQIATASIGSFPLMTIDQYEKASFWERFLYRATRHWFTILFGYFFVFIIGMCTKSVLTDPKRHWDSGFALAVHFLLMGFFIYLGHGLVWWSFLIPLMVACCSGAYLFYIQHNFPEMELRPRAEWDYVDAALRSSSFMNTNPVMHWFTGNIGYHHVHHLNPTIPFYKLPLAMQGIKVLQNPGTTTLSFSDIHHCLSLLLWDASAKRMITKQEWRSRNQARPLVENKAY